MQAETLSGGFTDPARDAARAFRSVMDAIAHPGTLYGISGAQPPAPLSVAAGSTILTLCDTDTPIYLAGEADCPAVRSWIAFHTGAPIVDAAHCQFALGTWQALMPLSRYSIGTSEYPDRSATLIVETKDLQAKGSTLSGPGIKDTAQLNLPDPQALAANNAQFPLGLDMVFTCAGQIAALPRSTTIHMTETA